MIFREFLEHREPSWTTHSPDVQKMLEQNDAALMIGDPAMSFSRSGVERLGHGGLMAKLHRPRFRFCHVDG